MACSCRHYFLYHARNKQECDGVNYNCRKCVTQQRYNYCPGNPETQEAIPLIAQPCHNSFFFPSATEQHATNNLYLSHMPHILCPHVHCKTTCHKQFISKPHATHFKPQCALQNNMPQIFIFL